MSLKINVSKETFLSSLGSLQNVAGKKGTMAVLANILIKTQKNNVELMGTDLEVGIKKILAAEIISPGSISLPAKKLFEIVRESGADTINIEEKEKNWVKIKSGTSTYNIAGIASEEYPAFPDYKEKDFFSINSEVFRELIEKTIFSVAQDRESNYTLTGMFFEKETRDKKTYLRMVSSDGHRLSIVEKEVDTEFENLNLEKNILIPKKGVIEIKKLCEGAENLQFSIEKKQIVLKNEDTLIIIRLMGGEFPDYKNIIDVIDKEKFLETERKVFLEALKRTNIFTEETFNAIQLDIKKDKMTLSSQNMDFGNATDELKIEYKGEDISLGFNCRYFIETLQAMRADKIRVYIATDQSPCLIRSEEDKGFLSVIMPMKI